MENLSFSKQQSWLNWFLKGTLLLGFLLLFGRLAELQIIKGAYFRQLSEGNRIRRIRLVAPRGEILARGGEVLATSREVSDTDEDGFVDKWVRYYPLGPLAAHITGYLGESSAEEVGKVDAHCPDRGPSPYGYWTGRSGLEQVYDCTLRGFDGEQLVEVDSKGERIRVLGENKPTKGESITTKIDLELQKKIAEAMEGFPGVAIATETTGQVLAIYSSPSFDPNVFNQKDKTSIKKRSNILTDKNLPLFNRAVSGTYHPGSIYKIVTATAALEEEKIDRNYRYTDTGIVEVNDFSYTNWYFTQYGGQEGEIGLVKALARSTDTFFYKVGEELGVRNLVNWSQKYGLDRKTEIDLPGEAAGLVPSPEWKEEVKNESWFLGNTFHMAIGQGDLTTTPIGAHRITQVVASNGKLCHPYLYSESGSTNCQDIGVNQDHLEIIKEGMIAACTSGGTGNEFFDFELEVACKTGTAETNEEDKTHAWFTIMAPAKFPEIVLTILVEKGGEGSKVAAPIARDIMDHWFGFETDEEEEIQNTEVEL